MVYDVTDPARSSFVTYTTPRGRLTASRRWARRVVTVHGAAGDCPVFWPKAQPFEYGLTENTGLSPSAAEGGQSHFRGEDARYFDAMSTAPRKLGQSPVNGYQAGASS